VGGIFGRELARAQPEVVRRVITLGSRSDWGDRDREQGYSSGVDDARSGIHSDRADGPRPPEDVRPPIPVPVTNIYTRTDGFAHGAAASTSTAPTRQREATGSHSGLGHTRALSPWSADRRALPDGTRQPLSVAPCLAVAEP